MPEPFAVGLLGHGTVGSAFQALLEQRISVPTRSVPSIVLEEVDGDEVVVRIRATPALAADGPQLADEVLLSIHDVTASDAATVTDAPMTGDAQDSATRATATAAPPGNGYREGG